MIKFLRNDKEAEITGEYIACKITLKFVKKKMVLVLNVLSNSCACNSFLLTDFNE